MFSTSSTASSVTEAPRRMFAPTWTWTKPSWPQPELSIGRELESLDSSRRCWDIQGPVLELATTIYGGVQRELNLRYEYLHERERIRKEVMFRMYMVGRRKEDANPTLMFICLREQPRRRAKEVVKDSGILREHPAIRLLHNNRPPQAPTPFRILVGPMQQIQTDSELFGEVYCISPVNRTCGVPVFTRRTDGSFRKATIGGIVQLGHVYYGLTVAHTFVDDGFERTEDVDDFSSEMECSFDSDDEPSMDELNEQAARVESGRRSSRSQRSRHASSFGTATLSRAMQHIDENEAISSVVGTLFQHSTHSGLDWALIEIDNSRVDPGSCNAITLTNEYEERTLWPRALVTTGPTDRAVLAVTGDKGVIQGWMSPNSIYMRTAQTRGFQELWTIHMTSGLVEGDCGSWVVDRENGQLYGQIVAGHPGSGVGYIIPASQIFESIWQTLGDALILPSRTSVNSSASTTQVQRRFVSSRQDRRQEPYELYRSQGDSSHYESSEPLSQFHSRPRVPRVQPSHAQETLFSEPSPEPPVSLKVEHPRQAIRDDMESLFSDQNLLDDFRLRSCMDDQGYVTLASIIALELQGSLVDDIRAVCTTLPFLELGGSDRVRRRYDWARWVLPFEERHRLLIVNQSDPYSKSSIQRDHSENSYTTSLGKHDPQYSQQSMRRGKLESARNSHFADPKMESSRQSSEVVRGVRSKSNVAYENPNDEAIARILQRNEKDARRSEKRSSSPVDPARPIYTRLSRRHLSLETLRVHRVDYEIDPADPDFVLVKRWIPEEEQDDLWAHTRKIRTNILSPPDDGTRRNDYAPGKSSHLLGVGKDEKSLGNEAVDQSPPCNTLFVLNIASGTSEDELKELFSKQPGYKRLCFRTKQAGPICFVQFEDVPTATRALNQLNGFKLRGNYIQNGRNEGIRLCYSKEPLGMRSGQDVEARKSFSQSPGLRQSTMGSIPNPEDVKYADELGRSLSDTFDSAVTQSNLDLEEAIKQSRSVFDGQSEVLEVNKSRGLKSKGSKSPGKASYSESEIGSEATATSKRTRDSNPSPLLTFLTGGKKRS